MRRNAVLVLLVVAGSSICWWPVTKEPSLDLPAWVPLIVIALCCCLATILARGKWLRFVAASSFGALINYVLTLVVLQHFPRTPPQVAALLGIAVGTGVNFMASRYLVFRATHVRLDKE